MKKIYSTALLFFLLIVVLYPSDTLAVEGSVLNSNGGTLATGKYYLNSNINLINNITIASGQNVTLDLNGYILKGNGNGSVITNNGILIIKDSNPNSIHKGTLRNLTQNEITKYNISDAISFNEYDQNRKYYWEYDNSGNDLIYGGIITGGKATDNGGAIYLNNGSQLEIQSGTIAGNYAKLGGAVYIDTGASVRVIGGTVSYNTAVNAGGAIYSKNTLLMEDGIFHQNASGITGNASGGGVYMVPGTEFTMNGGTISNNRGVSGAGVMVDGAADRIGTFTMNGGVLSGNVAAGGTHTSYGNGAAIYSQFSQIYFNGGTIIGNIARRYGGAVNIHQGAQFHMEGNKNALIKGNVALYGGAISQESGACVVTINNNNLIITENIARHSGGAIMAAQGTVSINAGVISKNVANGEGVYDTWVRDIINIADSGTGGGILMYTSLGGIDFKMTGGIIEENKATNNAGGAVALISKRNTEGEAAIAYDIVAEISGGSLSNNEADTKGGAIYVFLEKDATSVANVKVSGNSIINGNKAINGGAITVENGNVEIFDGTINNNIATQNGGTVYLSGGNLTISGGGIGGFENGQKLGSKAVKGGAIYVTGGNFNMNGGIIEGNTATESGGAIQISNGNVYITGGKISSNVARGEETEGTEGTINVGYGGGIFVDGGEIVSITGGEISNNVAAKNGGGIEIKTDKVVTVEIYSGSFLKNVADECGGAVGIDCDNGTINVGKVDCDGSSASEHSHPILLGNLAGKQGGGFYMSGKNAKLNIYCGSIDNNIVVDIENNFDQSSGIVTVYDGVEIGETNEGVIVIGGTFIDKRNTDEQKLNITYYCNYEGSADNKQAVVTKDAEITLPGDIFGIEDYEVIGWTTHPYNTTEAEYRAGEIIQLTESIELYAVWILDKKYEPSYIIVIPAEINFENETDIMIFDISATLNFFPRSKLLNINLSKEDYKLKYYASGNVKDTISYDLMRDEKKIKVGEVAASFNSDTSLISYEGKEELQLKLISKPRYSGVYEGELNFFVSIEDI